MPRHLSESCSETFSIPVVDVPDLIDRNLLLDRHGRSTAYLDWSQKPSRELGVQEDNSVTAYEDGYYELRSKLMKQDRMNE